LTKHDGFVITIFTSLSFLNRSLRFNFPVRAKYTTDPGEYTNNPFLMKTPPLSPENKKLIHPCHFVV